MTAENNTHSLRIGIAQLNPTVGDVEGNLAKVREARDTCGPDCDLLVFSELVATGYPPEDLVLRPAVIETIRTAIESLARETKGGPALLVTAPWRVDGLLYNAAILLDGGDIAAVRLKHELPNYGVFDEKRVFAAGPLPDVLEFRGVRLGVMVCEDMWYPTVARHLADRGAALLIVPNGSPFERGKFHKRLELASQRAADTGLPLIYINQIGGQDELVFDGGSFAVDASGTMVAGLPFWKEATAVTSWSSTSSGWTCASSPVAAEPAEPGNTYRALMIGLRDYVNKNRFPGVVLGLSGGIDSAVSAAVAVDALGPDRVLGVRLPSRFTSDESQDDATDSAQRLGMRLETISIVDVVASAEQALAPIFGNRLPDLTEENLQARARGLLLMALSNAFGLMLLTTGNKSEMSVGYATLYGDMCGGYSVLKDLYKTDVYELAEWRNRCRPADALGPSRDVIPQNVIVKAPTAELRPNQKDQDSLPEYAVLDSMLNGLVEQEKSVEDIVAEGHPPDVVRTTQNMLFAAEYKRRQAPPGVKTSSRSFGRDRRYPITNRFRER